MPTNQVRIPNLPKRVIMPDFTPEEKQLILARLADLFGTHNLHFDLMQGVFDQLLKYGEVTLEGTDYVSPEVQGLIADKQESYQVEPDVPQECGKYKLTFTLNNGNLTCSAQDSNGGDYGFDRNF